MRALYRFLWGGVLAALSISAQAQVLQSGTVSPNHATCWVTSGVIKDCGSISGTGTVFSVGLTMPPLVFSVAGSPVTSSGTLAVSLLTQSPNRIFAGPVSGVPLAPGFRALVGADLPFPGPLSLGGVQSAGPIAHQWINAISILGVPSLSQPSYSDISGTLPPTTIADGSITNAKLASMPGFTFKANNTVALAAPLDITGTQATALLTPFAGDGGSGGTKGIVPAPDAGDAAAGKYLAAGGSWAVVPVFIGDTGSGGVKGLVPAPASGDAGKVLGASGGWVTNGGGGGITGPGTTTAGFVPTWGDAVGGSLTAGLNVTTTNAANSLTKTGGTGTLDGTLLPFPAVGALGGVKSKAVVANQFLTGLDATGALSASQPSCGTLSDSHNGCSTTVGTIAGQDASAVNITGATLITGLPAPVNPADAATKSYVDSVATTGNPHAPVAYATAAVLPNTPTYNNGAGTLTDGTAGAVLVVDGQNVTVVGTRVLVKDQASGFQNGIYTLTTAGSAGTIPWVLTRAADFNTVAAGNIATGAYTFTCGSCYALTPGSTNDAKSYSMNTTGTIILGTTDLTWVQINNTTTYTAGAPITLTGSVFGFQAIPATSVPANTTGGSATPSGNIVYGTGCAASTLVETGGGGTIASACLPNPSSSTLGGIRSLAAVASKWINTISTSGIPSATQPAFSDISGAVTLGQLPAIGQNTVLGSIAVGSNPPIALSQAQLADLFVLTTTTGISAAGTTQGGATALSAYVNAVSTVSLGTGVRLPTLTAGKVYYVTNGGANPLLIYPPAGAAIDNLGTNIPVSLSTNATGSFIVTSSSTVRSVGVTTTLVSAPNAFYVSPAGNDSNAGTVSSPFLTLTKCQTAMRAAGGFGAQRTCYLRAGAYTVTGSTGTPAMTLDYRDAGETWSYYPPDGSWWTGSAPPEITMSGGTFPLFDTNDGANDITITGLSVIGTGAAFRTGSCGADSGSMFVRTNASQNINLTITYNKLFTFDCAIALQGSINPVVSFNYLNGAAYAAIVCSDCVGADRQTLWQGNIVANVGVGGAANNNAYGIVFNTSDTGMAMNFTLQHNAVYNVPTWECFDNHSGRNIWWLENICVGAGGSSTGTIHAVALSAASSPTGYPLMQINGKIIGNVVDGGSYGQTDVYSMCGNGTNCSLSRADISGGVISNNIGLVGSGFGDISPVVTTSGNTINLSPEVASTISLSASTFTANQPNAVVATINVNMSAAYWQFPSNPGPGTLSIGGTNSGGFVICNLDKICQSAGGTAAGAYSDFSITATLAGMSGSPKTQASGTLTLTGS